MLADSIIFTIVKFKTTHILFCILLTFVGGKLLAQNHAIDSLRNVLGKEKDDTSKVKTLNALSRKLHFLGRLDSSQTCAEGALTLAEKLGYTTGRIGALAMIGGVYWVKGEYSKALDYYIKANDLSKEIGFKDGMAGNMNSMGVVYEMEGNYPKALDYYLQALSRYKEMNKKEGIATVYLALGNIYAEQADYPKSIEYAEKSLAIESEIGNMSGVATNLINLGVTYNAMGDNAKALSNYNKALVLENKLGDIDAVATILNNIGLIYIGQDSNTQALIYFKKALDISNKIGDRDGVAAYFIGLGTAYSRMKNYEKAKIYLDSGLNLAKNIGVKEIVKNAYWEKANLDTLTGNYMQGMKDYKKYVIYSDSLVNESETKKNVQAEMNFEFQQKQDAEKAEQDIKDAVSNQDKKRQLIIRDAFMGGFILMLVLAFFVFRSYRQKQRANIVITQQKEEVEKQKNLVEHQKELVEEKNKEVLDSITYAKRLQDAILPPLSLIKQHFPESFVLFKPKDIVAGDFYWMWNEVTSGNSSSGEVQSEIVLIAAADCTGHGVPGALVSVVCSNALNRTVKEFKITEPGKILDKVRDLVVETFSHRNHLGEKSENNVQDGMDISLAAIRYQPSVNGPLSVQWSGAYNSLWYVHEGALNEVAGNSQPVGKSDRPVPFNTYNLNLQKGDTMYLFTDGYADQFGGPKGKKFKYKLLHQLLLANAAKPMEEQKKVLESTLGEWQGNLEQVDDILIIGIRV